MCSNIDVEQIVSSDFGSLGDLFPQSEMKCRIRGCNNKVILNGEYALRRKVHAGEAGGHDGMMCDSCYETLKTLQDKIMPCSKPGCAGTWIWNRYQQLEAKVSGKIHEPKGYCDACRGEMNKGEDRQVPCRIKGCKNTWTWTRRMQYESKEANPPARLCDECFNQVHQLKDRELPCRIKGCSHTWKWNVYQQLEHVRAGQALENPPSKMCSECLKKFKELSNMEVACKMKECKNTWTYSVFEQLENLVKCKEGEEAKIPQKMCHSCFDFFVKAKNVEVECSNRGCNNKWTWTPGMQLSAKLRGLPTDTPPHRMCQECKEKLERLQDKELPCSEPGCSGTYTYAAKDQLKEELTGYRPGAKRCKACNEFLASHETQKITCEKCGKEFDWSSAEQLAESLGVAKKPVTCASCTMQDITRQMPEAPVKRVEEKPFTIAIPTKGAWSEEYAIRDWPAGMNLDEIHKMERASVRVVCIGDEQTDTNVPFEDSWPGKLEAKLRSNGDVAVLNVGIPGCSTELASRRLERDVVPFAPQWLIFSFAFADTLGHRTLPQDGEHLQAALKENSDAFVKFIELVKQMPEPPRLLCWLPNPVFPQKNGMNDAWKANADADEFAVRFYDANLRQLRSLAKKYDVALVDTQALFQCMGASSVQSCMKNWFQPNTEGAKYIANWIQAEMRKG